ncbi:MAG: helix-turn-helix domain-containing protein [Bacteroidota bacterium]
MTESLKKFAKELKLFRESKDITLQYIANRTKIDIKFLQAIEEGNFEILPELYIRAFIKEYAQVADFDVSEVMKKYQLARKGMIEEKSNPEKETKEKNPITDEILEQRRNENKKFFSEETKLEESSSSGNSPYKSYVINKSAYFIAAALVMVLTMLYFTFFSGSPKIESEISYSELDARTESRFELENKPAQEITIPEDDSLKLTLRTSARVWVKILSDNKMVYQSVMKENESITYKAEKEFRVSVGNAGFLSMELNKKQLQVPGSKGELRGYIINSDTVKSYILTVPTKNESRSQNQN